VPAKPAEGRSGEVKERRALERCCSRSSKPPRAPSGSLRSPPPPLRGGGLPGRIAGEDCQIIYAPPGCRTTRLPPGRGAHDTGFGKSA